VYFNGQLLGGEYYSLKSGSTIVTIANSYLNTFPEGKYAVDIVSTDGTTTRGYVQVSGLAAQRNGTSYNSSGTYSPKTGDSSNLALWISILVVCVVAIVIVVIIVGKNKKKNDEPKDKN
jgi:LPXTG-motif cell wall-anchored protein